MIADLCAFNLNAILVIIYHSYYLMPNYKLYIQILPRFYVYVVMMQFNLNHQSDKLENYMNPNNSTIDLYFSFI